METPSKLDYVMKALNISGKSLAEDLMVDKTLISKWRNQHRKLSYDNIYCRKLAQYLLTSEAEEKRKVIYHILKSYRPDSSLVTMKEKIEIFCLWLTEETIEVNQKDNRKQKRVYTPRHGYLTNVSIFLGDKGIYEAVEYFMKYLLSLSPGKVMYMIDYSGINWNYGEESSDKKMRIHAFMELFRPVLEYGHQFIIVDCDSDIHRPYRAIFRWMDLYLTDGVEVLVHPRLHEEQYHTTSFYVKDEIALQCISSKDYPDRQQGIMYHNTDTIDFLTSSAHSIYTRSKKLIETMAVKDVLPMMDVAGEYIKNRNRIYMLTPSLTLQNVGEDILLKVLEENHVDDGAVADCLRIHKRFERLKKHCDYISLFNLDYLEEMSSMTRIVDSNLSEICGKKIVISKETWNEILRSIINNKQEESKLVFVSFRYLSYIPENLSILVQDDCLVAAWNVNKYKKRMYCINPNVISGFYRYLDDIWHMIPSICKETSWRNKQLNRLLMNADES